MASTESPSTPPGLKPTPPQGAARAAAPPARYEPVIKCIGLTKVFRDFWLRQRVTAVDGIDLDVCRGDVFGLLGPNGSGKSTTIKLMLGLLHPTAGRVAVLGKHPQDVQTKMQIGYLPEESYLYPFLNARETLDYYGTLFHLPRRQRLQRIDMLLDMVGLQGAQHRPVGQYSKGMQRRIGLAQALINDPELLILDEPTNGLDPIGARQIKDLILELSQRRKTILLCSHLLADVEDVCTRVAIMYGGKVRATGTVDELLVRKDITAIQVEGLNEDDLRDLGAMLEARGKHIDHVDKPRRKLESLFLDIVRQAQTQGVSTGGAKAGGQIAQFLKSDPSNASQGDSVIAALTAAGAATVAPRTTSPPPGQPEPKTPTASEAQPQARPTQPEEADVVDRLVKAAQPPAPPPVEPTEQQTPGHTQQPPTADTEDTSVIEQLVSAEPLDTPSSEPTAAEPPPDVAKAPAASPPAPPPQADAPQSPPQAGTPSPFEKILEQQALEPWEGDEDDDADSHEAVKTEAQPPASPRDDASASSDDASPAKPKPVSPPHTVSERSQPDPSQPHEEKPYESFTEAVEDVPPYDPDAP